MSELVYCARPLLAKNVSKPAGVPVTGATGQTMPAAYANTPQPMQLRAPQTGNLDLSSSPAHRTHTVLGCSRTGLSASSR